MFWKIWETSWFYSIEMWNKHRCVYRNYGIIKTSGNKTDALKTIRDYLEKDCYERFGYTGDIIFVAFNKI